MLAVVSHDIKNPLSAIHLEAQMLMRTVDRYGKSVMGEEVKVQAGRILKTAERMKSLIVDLLEKNKSQDGLKSLQRTIVDPVKLFYESLDNVRPLIQEKNIEVKFSAKENIPQLELDRNKMYQVFSNLLSNAIKVTPPKGEIFFDLLWDDEDFSFSLTDTGPGLPAGEEEKVFDKYWTGKRSRGSGTGLGLFICRSIIEAHGGRISCGNTPGKGASFTFTVPREIEKAAREFSSGEIFIVDDDEDLCEVMTWSLKKEGLKVRSFQSGGEALKALRYSRPSVLVVDFHLGDMDGCEFLEKRGKISKECPVILVSGSPDEVECSAPAGEYVSIVEKPLDLEGLLREIKNLNAPYSPRSSSEASTHFSHGPASAG
jgi:CheY-like chemotaxis protein